VTLPGPPKPHPAASPCPDGRVRSFLLLAFITLLATRALAAEPTPAPETRTFASRILGRDIPYSVLLPPRDIPSDPSQRLPVLYWLPDNSTNPPNASLPTALVHDAIRRRALPPLLVVYVHQGASSWYADAPSGLSPASTIIAHELVPAVDRAFPTLADRRNRAIQGVGRGGFGAFLLALTQPDLFGSAAALDGRFPSTNDFQTDPAWKQAFLDVFGSDPARLATNHPVALARTRAEQVRGRTSFRLAAERGSPAAAETATLRNALRDQRLHCEWWEPRPPSPATSADTTHEALLESLEFAASSFSAARATDRDGPWVNPPDRLPPRLRHHLVHSDILDRPVGYCLYLPPGMPPVPDEGLPVIYHLHGRDEDEGRHLEATGYLDVAISLKDVPPIAWVWLYGGRASWFMDSADGRVPAQSVLLEEVIPHIEERWNLGGTPERRAVDGWGMGAYGATRYAALVPRFFGAALIHNPILPDLDSLPGRFPDAWSSVFNTNPRYFTETEPLRALARHTATLRDHLHLRIVAGERSPALPDAQRLRDHLQNLQLTPEFESVPGVAGSGPELLRHTGLRDLRFLGRALTRPERPVNLDQK